MANVLVYIELLEDKPTAASLEALGEGRRLASTLGATLDAMVPCDKLPEMPIGPGDNDLIAILSRHGADRVIVLTAPQLKPPLMYATHGEAIAATCEEERPTMVLFPATSGPRDVAPRLAARLGAAYIPEPAFEYGPRGELVLSRTVFGGLFRRRLAVDDLERPVVVTLSPGAMQPEAGDEEAEVVMLAAPPLEKSTLEELSRKPDPGAVLDEARVIVGAGAGVGSPEGWQLVCELARALGGEAAATHEACRRGFAPPEREIGIGARRIAPRLYISCGASGSPGHLVALSGDTEIVAINNDPKAAIFRVAQYGIVGDLAEVLPALVRALAPEAKKDSA